MPDSPKILSMVWDLMRGGTEGQCARTALQHVSQGLDHRIAVFRRRGFFLERVRAGCGDPYEINITKMVSAETWNEVQLLANHISRERFDVVHAWDADAAIFGYLAAKKAGVPFISSRRNLADCLSLRKKWILRYIDAKSDALIVNAKAIRQEVLSKRLDEHKIHHIPNIVDLEDFDREAGEAFDRLSQANKKFIGMVCRLEREKDVEAALQALKIILTEYQEAHLVVAGDGEQRVALKAMVLGLNLTEHVTWLGDCNEIPAFLKHCDIAILTPRANEGLSNAVLEYMAAGKAFVVTDVGGNRALVEQSSAGFVVPVDDIESLASEILRLLKNADVADEMGQRGREYVMERNDPAVIGDQFLAVYESVLGSVGIE